LISGVILVAVGISFFFAFDVRTHIETDDDALVALPAFLFYLIAYAVGIFFQAAVVAGATERLRGGNPTIGSALGAASKRLGSILAWALVAATVGIILRSIQERAGFIGKIVIALVGAAWSLATFFVVPVIVLEEKPMSESFKRSIEVFKKTWGETMAGGVTIGLAALCAWLTLIMVVVLLAMAGLAIVAAFVALAGGVTLAVLFSALEGVFVASLYQYATGNHSPSGVDATLLADAFRGNSGRI
jgi:hypothetical protein